MSAAIAISNREHVLYRFFDSSGALLYVGITANPQARFSKHAGEKDWWPSVSEIKMCRFRDRDSVLQAEREAIRTEKPRHNIQHVSRDGSTPTTTPTEEADGLVGRFFHTFDDSSDGPTKIKGRTVRWQGRVLEEVRADVFLIELYSWWDGLPNGSRLASLETMFDWQFYDSSLEMQLALPCGEYHGPSNYCQGERAYYHDIRGIGPHFVCAACTERYPGFANYQPVSWVDGKPVLR